MIQNRKLAEKITNIKSIILFYNLRLSDPLLPKTLIEQTEDALVECFQELAYLERQDHLVRPAIN